MSVPGRTRGSTDHAVLDAYTPERGDPRYRVEHYDLDLDYRVSSNRLSGRATLAVRALAHVESLRVDLVGLRVGKVTVAGATVKWTHRGHAVTVRLPRALEAGAGTEVAITYSGCLGPCDNGPNVLVYPEGVLYSGVSAADVVEIFDSHLEGGKPVERLLAEAGVW